MIVCLTIMRRYDITVEIHYGVRIYPGVRIYLFSGFILSINANTIILINILS